MYHYFQYHHYHHADRWELHTEESLPSKSPMALCIHMKVCVRDFIASLRLTLYRVTSNRVIIIIIIIIADKLGEWLLKEIEEFLLRSLIP